VWEALTKDITEGLVIVMDGMGERYADLKKGGTDYETDFSCKVIENSVLENSVVENFVILPRDVEERSKTSEFRESESAYKFFLDCNGRIVLKPIFKRFAPVSRHAHLHNHGFYDFNSVGGGYSRVSGHIFGGWDYCGKVMGLSGYGGSSSEGDLASRVISGSVWDENDPLTINYDLISATPLSPSLSSSLPDAPLVNLAVETQSSFASLVTSFVQYCLSLSGSPDSNVLFAGGVALNSVVNGRLSREVVKGKFVVPAFPGDEGIAVGCAVAGLDVVKTGGAIESSGGKYKQMPFFGRVYPPSSMLSALKKFHPSLICYDLLSSPDDLITTVVDEIEGNKGVVAWFQGSSEMGPRALGHRSLIADPRGEDVRQFINEKVRRLLSFVSVVFRVFVHRRHVFLIIIHHLVVFFNSLQTDKTSRNLASLCSQRPPLSGFYLLSPQRAPWGRS